jgi:hypothetical protein
MDVFRLKMASSLEVLSSSSVRKTCRDVEEKKDNKNEGV